MPGFNTALRLRCASYIRLGTLLLAGLSFAPVILGQPVSGYFETKPDGGGARNVMCVKKLPNGAFDVDIVTAYCPTIPGECYNARIDGIQFTSALVKNRISYAEPNGCRIKIKFNRKSAVISQDANCRNSERPYLYAGGHYQFVKPEVDESDCRP